MGRYLLYGPIASGGMATVHFGALVGEAGFSRTVAIKRIRADRRSPELLAGLVDEARLVSRVQHPNVVSTLDVVSDADELFVVLEYIAGETLAHLLRSCEDQEARIPPRIATTIIAGVLHGLHAAHDAKSARAKPLGIVHRDVSPQNILVGIDGLARVLDFGIAKASERLSSTYEGQLKGKLAYMAPEQIHDQVDRRTDIYATAVVLWEMLAGQRLFWGKLTGDVMQKLLEMQVPPPSRHAPDVSPELDRLVLRGLARDPNDRFASARHFALALEEAMGIATATQIGSWVQELAGEGLSARAEKVAALERHALGHADGADVTTSHGGRPRGGEARRAESTRPISTPPPDEPHTREIADETELSQENVVADELSTMAMMRPSGIVAEPPPPAEMETAVTTALDTPVRYRDEPVTMSTFVPRSRWRSVLVAVAGLVGVGALLVWLVGRAPALPAAPAANAAGDEAASPPEEPSVAGTSAATVAASASETPPVDASASTSAPPASASALPSWTSSSSKPPPPLHSAPPPVRNCSPPYTIDARGVRRLKPECL